MRAVKIARSLFLVFAVTMPGMASTPGGVLSLTPAQKAIREAAAITDPVVREPRLREAIRAGLFASDTQTRELVFSYLADNVRWIDLRPYADLLEGYSRIDDLHYRALWLIDEDELMRAPRDQRSETYRRAIVDGRVALRRGDVVTRATALTMASLDGLTELKALVASFEAEALPGKGSELLPAMELRAGASDREEAAQLAAGRLAAMSDEEFEGRMNQDLGFRSAVLEVAGDACSVNPFSGVRNPGCAGIQEVARRQVALEKKTRESATVSSPGEHSRAKSPVRSEWLDRLKERSP